MRKHFLQHGKLSARNNLEFCSLEAFKHYKCDYLEKHVFDEHNY